MLTSLLAGTRAVLLASAVLVAPLPLAAQSQPVDESSLPAEANSEPSARVLALLGEMTLAEKIAVISGSAEPAETYQGQAGFLAGVPRLGIPALRLADGPHGVLTREISGAPPSTLSLAATFDPDDARALGAAIGRNARAHGVNISAQPFINLYRDPVGSRSYNTYGDDPFLVGQMGAGLIRGIQSENVMALAKHLVGYDGGNNVAIGGQALREVYLEPFRAAVEADVASIMCAYNKINGPYACDSHEVQSDILRGEMGYQGFVVSDWGGLHGAEFINSGMDLEMPGDQGESVMSDLLPAYFTLRAEPRPMRPPDMEFLRSIRPGDIPEEAAVRSAEPGMPMPGMTTRETLQAGRSHSLAQALSAGTVEMATIDRAVARILGQMERFGWLDGGAGSQVYPEDVAGNAPLFQRVAERSAVLLKNEGNILPLVGLENTRLALIGPGARQALAVVKGGEKSLGWPDRQIGPDRYLEQMGGNVTVAPATDMEGAIVAADLLSLEGSPGIRLTLNGQDMGREATINRTLANGNPLPPDSTAEWSGELSVAADGEYDLNLQILGAYGSLEVDGELVGQTSNLLLHGDTLQAGQDNIAPTLDGLDNVRRRVRLTAGQHRLMVRVRPDTSGNPAQVRLTWNTPAMREGELAAAIEAARAADVAIVFAWSRGKPDPFGLPGNQDDLIAAVAAVNPNTVVVLQTGQPVAMPWLDHVRGVVQMWYPGDEGGAAMANVLTGRSSVGGRLPFAWPVRLQDNVAHDPAHPERATTEAGGVTTYSEGVLIGQRWHDSQGIAPLFPFGFGLSYTTFEYAGLNLARNDAGDIVASFTVRNTGDRPGDVVPQVYLGAPVSPPADGQFAPRTLVGFERLSMAPGEVRQVSIPVRARQLRYWSDAAHAWRTPAGNRTLYVGDNGGEMILQAALPDG